MNDTIQRHVIVPPHLATSEDAERVCQAFTNLEEGNLSMADIRLMNGMLTVYPDDDYDPRDDEFFVYVTPARRF